MEREVRKRAWIMGGVVDVRREGWPVAVCGGTRYGSSPV